MQYIRIKEWDKFQHYKDRSPPWIKLHKAMMTSRTWVSLDDAGRVLAFACMMLAADTDNKTPLDPVYLRRVAYLNQNPDFGPLLGVGFIEIIEEDGSNASKTLAKRTECPPEERRGETDPASAKKPRKQSLPDGWSPKEETVAVLGRELGLVPQDVLRYVAPFADYCLSSGKTYTNHDAAFRNCVRQDWPRLRNGKPPAQSIQVDA